MSNTYCSSVKKEPFFKCSSHARSWSFWTCHNFLTCQLNNLFCSQFLLYTKCSPRLESNLIFACSPPSDRSSTAPAVTPVTALEIDKQKQNPKTLFYDHCMIIFSLFHWRKKAPSFYDLLWLLVLRLCCGSSCCSWWCWCWMLILMPILRPIFMLMLAAWLGWMEGPRPHWKKAKNR